MISSLTSGNQQFLNNLNRVIDRLNRDQLQIASGVKMQQVSDEPDQVSDLLQARASLAASKQITTNLVSVKSEVDTGEQTLATAVTLFDQVQTLATQGATGTQTAASRATTAQQLQSIEQQLVGLANTQMEGRYIFSGDTDQTAPYSYDATQTDPVSAYQGTASTRVALDPSGSTFPVALTAQQIFDSSNPSTNVFTALNTLITAFQNNDQATAQTEASNLGAIGSYINNQLAFYGTTQDKVAAATDDAATQQTEIQVQIGGLEDADTTSAILDMTQMQTAEQASLQSRGNIPRTTLFDFLG